MRQKKHGPQNFVIFPNAKIKNAEESIGNSDIWLEICRYILRMQMMVTVNRTIGGMLQWIIQVMHVSM